MSSARVFSGSQTATFFYEKNSAVRRWSTLRVDSQLLACELLKIAKIRDFGVRGRKLRAFLVTKSDLSDSRARRGKFGVLSSGAKVIFPALRAKTPKNRLVGFEGKWRSSSSLRVGTQNAIFRRFCRFWSGCFCEISQNFASGAERISRR